MNKIKFLNLCSYDQNNGINAKGNITTDIENILEIVIKYFVPSLYCNQFDHLCLNNCLNEYTLWKLFQSNEEILNRPIILE